MFDKIKVIVDVACSSSMPLFEHVISFVKKFLIYISLWSRQVALTPANE